MGFTPMRFELYMARGNRKAGLKGGKGQMGLVTGEEEVEGLQRLAFSDAVFPKGAPRREENVSLLGRRSPRESSSDVRTLAAKASVELVMLEEELVDEGSLEGGLLRRHFGRTPLSDSSTFRAAFTSIADKRSPRPAR